MTTHHPPVNWTAGDDWQINATLLDENGNPYNLTGLPSNAIMWALLDSHYHRVIDQSTISISVVDGPTGKCKIMIPSAQSTKLAGGRYTDAIRIVYQGITSTLSYGTINVWADPWAAAVAQATLRLVVA